jgi:hypothetical protein
MPQMTLPEYAKGLDKGDIRRPIVEVFAASSDIMAALPWVGFNGAAYETYRQGAMPDGIAFRGINEGSTTGMGRIDPYQEVSFPIDHDADVDRAIVDRHGMERRAMEERLSIARVGRLWADTFITGDNTTEPREPNGIQKRIALYGASTETNTRTIHNSAASGGAALSLVNLDLAIAMVRNPTHLLMPRRMMPLLTAAARTTAIAGYIIQTWDDIGRQKFSYAGLPILFGYGREIEGDLLNFNEVASGGGAAVTASIYVLSLAEDGLHGIQLKPLHAEDVGLLEDRITYRTHITWDVGLAEEHPFCMARLTSITNAAIVA